MPGLFITIEGIECVGKSTNAKFISDYLEKKKIKSHITREPGGTKVAEKIRNILLYEKQEVISPMGELMLLFAARDSHINEIIKPKLSNGFWVICDRFTDASFAYQGHGRGLGFDVVNSFKELVQKDFEPDLTLLLDAPVHVIKSRRKLNPNDRFESEKDIFFKKIRTGYLEIAENNKERIKVIDASRSIKLVQTDIKRHLDSLIKSCK
ncbi:MAG: dTMP kinase [Gammaproteobacteria bacterium]|jgi:dTMP kinase|nr:dTMP kinase [Gammaproteobacteria bacterium]MBT5216363.1 dTMP kinase [Gammaproteobacteria bacterium]MBT5541853.1 dTMP kinase [Gammaproteobacteria bacterium]MBT6074801.1 dTMP kinase [Gammaproteobacteria bacterium]MBT7754475.1 dTMP kinase [Gammaproteobacteria bacterium]